jgi:hypothetical protein
MEWLKAFNSELKRSEKGAALTEDDMEALIDLFEKESGKITLRNELMSSDDKIDPTNYFTLAQAMIAAATRLNIKGKPVESVYSYWISKRKRLGKSLMRIFQEPPPKNNTDPHVAFRPRVEGRRISKRNPRKDDTSGYVKMIYLKRDFQRVLDIIEQQQLRDNAKYNQVLLNTQAFDEKLAQTQFSTKLQQQFAHIPYPQLIAQAQNPSTNANLPKIVSLLRSTLPLCNWSKIEADIERKKSKNKRSAIQKQQQMAANAQAAAVAQKAKSSSQRAKYSGAASGRGRGAEGLSAVAEEETESESEAEAVSSEDEYYSATEEDGEIYENYFREVEEHVKRMKLSKFTAEKEQSRIVNAFTTFPTNNFHQILRPSVILDEEEELRPPANLPQGIKGRCRMRLGRDNRLWLEKFDYNFEPATKHEIFGLESSMELENFNPTIKQLQFSGSNMLSDSDFKPLDDSLLYGSGAENKPNIPIPHTTATTATQDVLMQNNINLADTNPAANFNAILAKNSETFGNNTQVSVPPVPLHA